MSSQVATIRICDWILVVVLVGLLNDVLLECKLFIVIGVLSIDFWTDAT